MTEEDQLRFALADLRVKCFAALKGWGSVREDGKWEAWRWKELCREADLLSAWAFLEAHPYIRIAWDTSPVRPMLAADIGLAE